MNPNREEALFVLALEKPAAERAAFLELICGEDRTLRARIEALLVAHEQTEGVLAEASAAAAPTMKIEFADVPDETVGQKIGRYKILEKVGEGGCGVVYVAEQTEPVRRRVALKVIKLGMDTKQVVARFEAERQALAMMDHPNIARVLDAGSTETGRPYFIMELVRGIRITDYCDQEKVPTHERLELFIQICHAIQHAHQKGIIHRDIKPSNILVTLHDGAPVPKVIDFGIAKAMEGRLTDATVYTQLHQFIGTPAYMSPEQAEMSGLDVDTRSDIYSLGVLLYELLTGKTPFDANELMSQGIDAMRKTIREKDPVRPSTKLHTLQGDELTTTAKRHGADVRKLVSQLQGDLDWIVMKCLEKDRKRRYDTANGLAMDLKRHLNNETVVARPHSKLYEFQRTVRRHKVGFAATAAIIAVLAIGAVISTWQSVLATRAKRTALAAQASESVQRQKAEANEQKANEAQAAESKLREQAQAQELVARQRAYASDMNVAKQALDRNNLGQALDLLNRQHPQPGQKDLRGWEWRYLWKQTRSDASINLCQEPSEIRSLAVSHDALSVAVGTLRGDGVSVWDLRTRQEFQVATNVTFAHVAFSPTDPLLAFTSTTSPAFGQTTNTLRLFNTATRHRMPDLPLDSRCEGLTFSEDGRTLVTFTRGGIATVWQVSDGAELTHYPLDDYYFTMTSCSAASADLALAAYPLEGGRIRVINLREGKPLWTRRGVKEDSQHIAALAFSPDGKILASGAGYSEPDIRLWDVDTGTELEPLEGHGSWVSSLVFWPDGKKLASASADQTIRIWDVTTGKCLDVLRGHRQEIWRLALSPDHNTLVSGAKDGTVSCWNVSRTHPHWRSTTNVVRDNMDWHFSPDGRSILTLDRRGKVTQWTGEDFSQPSLLFPVQEPIDLRRHPWNSSRFSQDGRFLAVTSTNGNLQVWDTSQKSLVPQLPNAPGLVLPQAFLADGRKLITYSESDQLLREWDLTTGGEIQSWEAPASFNGVALTPDEQSCLAFTFSDRGSVLRNLVDQSQTRLNIEAPETDVGVFSPPDGNLFAIASSMGFGRVWNTSTWKQEATLGNFLNGVHSAAFSPNGKRLAIAGHDKEAIRLYDTEGWQDVITLDGPGGLASTAFSPDGNSVVWETKDAFVVWRAPTWEEIDAREANDPPSPGSGAIGKMEARQP